MIRRTASSDWDSDEGGSCSSYGTFGCELRRKLQQCTGENTEKEKKEAGRWRKRVEAGKQM